MRLDPAAAFFEAFHFTGGTCFPQPAPVHFECEHG